MKKGLVISLIVAVLIPNLKPLLAYGYNPSPAKGRFVLFCMVSEEGACNHKVCPLKTDNGGLQGLSCDTYLMCDSSQGSQASSSATQDVMPFLPVNPLIQEHHPVLSILWEGTPIYTNYFPPSIERPPSS
ncbi:MAG: hypothetical protein HY878_00905 [Deltaproteobacteria bacterium]|nr:hypothetical protein [Deltaproteobacteria bacterium]